MITNERLPEGETGAATSEYAKVELLASEKIESFLMTMSHDVRGPLGAIIGFNDLLKSGGLTAADVAQFTSVIEKNAHFILKFLDESLANFRTNRIIAATSDEAVTSSVHKSDSLSGMKILVADDMADNRTLICVVLKNAGAEIDVVINGQEAIDAAAGKKYDAVVLDIHMPMVDGYGALSAIRLKDPAMPIVALTAYATNDQRLKALGYGFSDFAAKPLDQKLLVGILAKYNKIEQTSTSITGRSSEVWPSILIVEDDLDTRELISIVASDLGSKTVATGDATSALTLLESGFTPDLVFLDLTLPDVSGAQFLDKLRADDRWTKLKVILLSGWDNLADKALAMGADGSLRKPFDVDSIERLIRSHSV